jgi:protocatechuate 3,4-dioxygenase beta subunit
MFRTTLSQVIGKSLSIVLLTAVLVTSFLVFPQPASSTTTLTLPVRVEDSAENPLSGFEIEFCHEGSGEWVCDTTEPSDADGEAVLSLSLPNDTGFVQLSAGGHPSEYSRTWTGVTYVDGVASVQGVPTPQPVLTLNETDWITTSVTVLNEISQPVRNEWIRISTQIQGFGDFYWTMSYWAETNDSGVATFHLDVETWGGEREITAEVGAMGFGGHAPASSLVSIEDMVGTATINTRSLSYTLSGVVTDHLDQPIANTDLCLLYRNFSTEKTVEVDFSTSSNGSYSIPGVKSTMVHFKPQACDLFDEDLTYDFQTWYELDEIEGYVQGSDITFNPKFTKTGIRVRVVDDQNVPLAFVTVGLEAKPMGEFDHRRQAVTNQEGIAYFSSLNPDTDYEISHKLSDRPWEAQRFEDKTNPEFTRTLASNTIVEADLELVRAEFPDTPVTVSGRLLDENDAPIANGTVQVNSNFGPGSSSYLGFRARTNSAGAFSVSNLPYGYISIDASAKGHRLISTSFEASSENGDVYNLGDFRLRQTVSGELQYSGVLRDTTGQPIADMELVLNTPYEAGGSVKKVDTDAQGRFSFDGLTQGHHWLYANSNWDEYEWSSWNFNLNSSRTQASLVLVGRGMTAPESEASISGRVFEYIDVEGPAAASPIVGYCVDVFPVDGGTVTRGTTDEDGYWTATGLSEGERYYIGQPKPCESQDNSGPSYDFGANYELPQPSSTTVIARISGGTPHEWVYREVSQTGPGSISGRVRDGEEYTNLAGVVVNIQRKNGGITVDSVTTDSRGEYEFTNLPAGEYILNIGSSFIGDIEYWETWSSVEVTTEANRANILLYKVFIDSGEGSENGGAWNGVVSGTVLDENGRPHGSANVEVYFPNEAGSLGGVVTKNDGSFELGFLPTGQNLILRIVPWWTEIAIAFMDLFIDDSSEIIGDINLNLGTSVSGQVSNIPQGVEVRAIFAELLDANTGTFVHSSPVDLETGQYVIGQVPDGNYKLRFTQNSRGGGWSEFTQNSISMKPVYWDDTEFGTKNISQGATVVVSGRVPVTQIDITYSEGAVLQGTVSIATQNGPVPLTGSRSLWVDLFRKSSSGDWSYFTYAEVSASTNYNFQFVGLAEGEYKISFRDSRSGNNSLIWNYNGGASTLEEAPEISIGEAETKILSHSMEVAPPEMSAEAFDLDDLGAERLAELVNEISIPQNASSGSELDIFVGTEFSGEFVSAFANSTPVLLGDWKQVDAEGYITVSIPRELPQGSHRIAVQDSRSVVFGWAPLSVVDAGSSSSSGTAQLLPPSSKKLQPVEPNKQELDEDQAPSTPDQPQAVDSPKPRNSETINELTLLLLAGFVSLSLLTLYWFNRSRRGLHSRR